MTLQVLAPDTQRFVLWVLVSVLTAFGGAIIAAAVLGFRIGIEIRDNFRDIHRVLYGDPDLNKSNGLLNQFGVAAGELTDLKQTVEGHCRDEMQWRLDNARLVTDHNNETQRVLGEIQKQLPKRKGDRP